jgi:hypothetical protein
MSGRVIFECAKRGGATVRFTIADYQGSRFLDIREWVEREGQPLATRKGATVPLEALAGAGEALISASSSIDASGAPGALSTVK